MNDVMDLERAPGAAERISQRSANAFQNAWDWFGANSEDIALGAAAAAVIVLLLLGLRRFGHYLIRERDEGVRWRIVFGRVLSRTNLFFIVMVAAKLVVAQTTAPQFLDRTVDILFVVAVAFQAAIWGRELVLGFIEGRVSEEGEEKTTLGSAIGIIRLIVTIALFSIAIILILSNLGVNVTGLVAGLGIGGIAIGLAAQGIFSDLFAALSIIFDRPFRKGDTISFGSPPTTGVVENIGLKSTRVRSLQGEEIVVSNANLLNMQLQNWAMLVRRRVVMQFGVIYQTPPDLLARVPQECERLVNEQALSTFDRCHAFQFGASSIDFELVFYVEAAEFAAGMQARQDVLIAMMRRFDELDIDFAYPTQMGFLAGQDGKPIDPRDIPTQFHPAP